MAERERGDAVDGPVVAAWYIARAVELFTAVTLRLPGGIDDPTLEVNPYELIECMVFAFALGLSDAGNAM
jgi:hypothetical protein